MDLHVLHHIFQKNHMRDLNDAEEKRLIDVILIYA